MRIAPLIRNEWIKTTRYIAFWIGLTAFAGIMAIQFGQRWWMARGNPKITFALPDAWTEITSDVTIVTASFVVIVVAMIIGGEYTWKTARQNVIDGLSKNEFYVGKILTWLAVAAVFGVLQILVGGVFAAAGTPAHSGAWIHGVNLAQIGGVGLCLAVLTSLGLFFAIASRSAAAGIGLFFLYIAFGERLIGMVVRLFGDSAAVARHLPMSLAQRAVAAWQWDPSILAEITKRAVASGGHGPVVMAPLVLVAWILGWTVVVAGGAYLIFRARDL